MDKKVTIGVLVKQLVDIWIQMLDYIDAIQIYNNGQNGGNLGFDNLSVIPEPATVGLFGLAGIVKLFCSS